MHGQFLAHKEQIWSGLRGGNQGEEGPVPRTAGDGSCAWLRSRSANEGRFEWCS